MCNYKLNIKEANCLLEIFNNGYEYLVSDYLVGKQFTGSLEELKSQIPCMVILLDNLFFTQLKMCPNGADTIISALKMNWSNIIGILSKCEVITLRDNPDKFYENVAKPIFEIMPEIKNNRGSMTWPYSFYTKFFHWCKREHFPIMDSNARVSINIFQKDNGFKTKKTIPSNKPTGKEVCIREYVKWIQFYSSVLNCDSNEILFRQQEDNADDGYLTIQNTPIRILDKYFYIKGKLRKKNKD